ncbi:MAG: hypothetical protein GY754_22505 [bacterium]|nr:hypothetical protein [bacterium]
MPVELIAVIVFLAAMVVVVFLMRNSTLDKVEYGDDESIIAEFDGLRVESKGMGPQTTVFLKSKVIITNQRVIIGQKMLFGKKYQGRYLIDTSNVVQKDGFGLKKGIVALKAHKEKMTPRLDDKKPCLEIIPEDGMFINEIKIFCPDPEALKDAMF